MFKGNINMFLKIRTLLLLTIVANTAVNADNQNAQLSNKDEHNLTNMTLVLNERLYEIQQNTSTIKFRVDSPVGEIWGSFQDFEGSFMMINNITNAAAVLTRYFSYCHTVNVFIR